MEKKVKFNRLYFFISRINQMLIKATDETTLFEEACRIAVEFGNFRMAWIGKADRQTHRVVPVAFAGEESGYLTNIKKITTDNVAEGQGPTGTALREGVYVVCNDIETEPMMAPWSAAATERGYLSSIALPLGVYGKTIGAFTIYAPEKNFFDTGEIELLQEMTGNIAFALENFEKEAVRQDTAAALLKSEKRYQTLAEIATVGIFHTDARGSTNYVNPRWCQISGMPREAALENGWLNAVHPEDRDQLHKNWEKAAINELPSASEYRFVRPDGTVRWVMGQSAPEKDEDNRVLGYVGTITDITERKKHEEEILLEKNLSDSIINSLPGVFYFYDREGKFLRWNKNFEKVSQYSPAEIAAMHPLDFFDPGKREYVRSRIDLVFETGHADAEAEFTARDKTQTPYYFTGRTIEYGGVTFLMGVGIDISERLSAQETIREYSEQLRQLADYLQDVREQERVYIAREIHDELGQQLTGLKMDLHWLKTEYGISEDVRAYIERILKLTDDAINTIRKIASALRPFILDDVGLPEALKWHSAEFEKRFGIKVLFETGLTKLAIAPKIAIGLFRIFQESLTNIARHAEANSVVSSLTCSDNQLILKIEDNGKGFDTVKALHKKTLGLIGMKERVLMMEGKYQLESVPGHGTCTTVVVPLKADTP